MAGQQVRGVVKGGPRHQAVGDKSECTCVIGCIQRLRPAKRLLKYWFQTEKSIEIKIPDPFACAEKIACDSFYAMEGSPFCATGRYFSSLLRTIRKEEKRDKKTEFNSFFYGNKRLE